MTERKETSLMRLASAVMTSQSAKDSANCLLRFTRSLSTCTEAEQREWVDQLELNLREICLLTDIVLHRRNQWCVAPESEAVCRYLASFLCGEPNTARSLSQKAQQLDRLYLAPARRSCSHRELVAVMDSICDACGLTKILKNTWRLELIRLPDVAKNGLPFVMLTDWACDNRAHRVHLVFPGTECESAEDNLSQFVEDAAAGIAATLVWLCFAERNESGIVLKLSSQLNGDIGEAFRLIGHGFLCKTLNGFRERLAKLRPEERDAAEPLADALIGTAQESLFRKSTDRRIVI